MANTSRKSLQDVLRDTLREKGFPASKPMSLTLRVNEKTRSYKSDSQPTPEADFLEAESMINQIQKRFQSDSQQGADSYVSHIIESMCQAIFSSNMNEEAGLSFKRTVQTCTRVFNGDAVDPTPIDEWCQGRDYQQDVEFLMKNRRLTGPNNIMQSRREVIQHAKAWMHLVEAFVARDEPLSEDLIFDTHRILCKGVPDQDGSHRYAGRYREKEVKAGDTLFGKWEKVPEGMQTFIEDFTRDVEEIKKEGKIDPFYLAADACQDFVMIHPFQDANGRMCRMLLNAYLLKYSGIVIGVGQHEHERAEYMERVKKASEEDLEEEARHEFARYVLEKGTAALKGLKRSIMKEEGPNGK